MMGSLFRSFSSDDEDYEGLQESMVFYRTHFCKKVMQITARKFQLEECDLAEHAFGQDGDGHPVLKNALTHKLDMQRGTVKKVNWKYNPKLSQDHIFEGEFGGVSKNRCKIKEGSNSLSNDSENLLKVTKMMKKMKFLKEVSEVDETIKEIPVEVLLEKLQKQFGVQVS